MITKNASLSLHNAITLIIENADKAMYTSKNRGKNKYILSANCWLNVSWQ